MIESRKSRLKWRHSKILPDRHDATSHGTARNGSKKCIQDSTPSRFIYFFYSRNEAQQWGKKHRTVVVNFEIEITKETDETVVDPENQQGNSRTKDNTI